MRKRWKNSILAIVLSASMFMPSSDCLVCAEEKNELPVEKNMAEESELPLNAEKNGEEETLEDPSENTAEEPAEIPVEVPQENRTEFPSEKSKDEEKFLFDTEESGWTGENKKNETEAEEELFFASEEGQNFEETELETDFWTEDTSDDLLSLYMEPENYVQEGTPVKDGAIGFIPVQPGKREFSSKYTRLGWNSDSKVIPWSTAGSDVVQGRRYGGVVQGPYFVPLNNNAKGKFGFRVTNVGYNKIADTKVDLLLTCTNYRDYSYDYKGNKITGLYPFLGMGDGEEIWILFKEELPLQEIRIDIVKSGTATPVTGNYRFRWLDIDVYQRFGFRLQNGTVGNRFATNNSVVNAYVKNVFSKSYEILTAPAGAVHGEVPENTVMYEIDNSSGFYLAILAPGYDKHSIETTEKIKSVYEDVITGETKYSAGLNWDSKSYGPVEYPELLKKTGNTLQSQTASNVLESSTAGYFYTLRTDIPEEQSDYYYSSCKLVDTLPQGVDYNGHAVVKMLPSEQDVSSWFRITTSGDVLRFEATEAALASEEFYGKTYEFQIGVKMDPTEISPVYNGDAYTYTVKNKASLACKHKTDKEGIKWSNEVSTIYTGTKNRILPAMVKKYTANLVNGVWASDVMLPLVDSVYKYKLSVDVPANEYGGYLTQLEIEDTLPDGVKLLTDHTEIYKNGTQRVESYFQVASTENGILLKAKPEALSDSSFYGKTYAVIMLVKLNQDQLSPIYSGNTGSYSVDNTFQITTKHKNDSKSSVLQSNKVTARAQITRPDVEKPEKWILDESGKTTQKIYENRTFSTEFEIVQKIPARSSGWSIKKLLIRDDLEKCLELKNADLFVNGKAEASFGNSSGNKGIWSFEYSDGTVQVSVDNLDSSYYGAELKLKLVAGLKKDYDLDAYYENNSASEEPIAHVYNMASSVVEWNQGTPAVIVQDTQTVELQIKEKNSKGTILVKKQNLSGEPLKDAVFEVVAAENIYGVDGKLLLSEGDRADLVVTDQNGSKATKELYLGKYSIKEMQPPPGYTINTTEETVEITAEDPEGTVVFQNEKTCVKIRKISQIERVSDFQEVIEGAVFLVWRKEEGKENGSCYTTDENGMIEITGLIPGTYYYREKEAPDGYVVNPTTYEFTISNKGLVSEKHGIVYDVVDNYTKAEFLKVDSVTGKAIKGAELELTDADGNVIDSWISAEKAHRINRLPEGEYTLTELAPPAGYQGGGVVKCILENNDKVQTFKIENTKKTQITVEKVLYENEIVWAHGNPIFTFQVEGTDLDGKKQMYFDTVEFRKEDRVSGTERRKRLTFTVPAGEYTVREIKTLRYELEKISEVKNGTVEGKEVYFDLKRNQSGNAAFYNKKVNDSQLTDTGFVRNTVIAQKD